MNQFLVILFTHLYLLMSMGASTHLHYCGQELVSVSILVPYNVCGCEEETEADNCCKNEIKITQIKDTQQAANPLLIPLVFFACIFTPKRLEWNSVRAIAQAQILPTWERPPPLMQDFNILYCVYRI